MNPPGQAKSPRSSRSGDPASGNRRDNPIHYTSDAECPDWQLRAGTLILAMDRERLLRYLPKRGHVAEIGVAKGKFSRKIAFRSRPRHLSLIDPWRHQSEDEWISSHNIEQLAQDRKHARVTRYFRRIAPLLRMKVNIVRNYSVEASRDFDDNSLDWVYIDGNHSHEAVRADLNCWAPKVVDDGFILGHDFARHTGAVRSEFGVVEAVRDFLADHPEYGLIAITTEHFPTFVIARCDGNQRLRCLLDRLFATQKSNLRVPTELVLDFWQVRIRGRAGRANFFDLTGMPRAA